MLANVFQLSLVPLNHPVQKPRIYLHQQELILFYELLHLYRML
nr:MAG TPA: hypothetical protein [Caudoviricetes sp.]DAO41488.1 MAG TPA: hypothetical protein [Bacteriophage sp.]